MHRRMIDWSRATTISGALAIISLLLTSTAFSTQQPTWGIAALAAFLLLVMMARTHFGGAVFDQASDTLTYPTLWLRRTIHLSAIRDANCQLVRRKHRYDNPARLTGEAGSQKHISFESTYYAVNLSGEDFDTREVRFWSRKRRDQFLSYLRQFVPTCRITRWSGGWS